jgi:hypothetical protein
VVRSWLFLLKCLLVLLLCQPSLAALEYPLSPDPGDIREAAGRFARFDLEVRADGEYAFVLGLNAFTAQQLVQFVSSLSGFLEAASALEDGDTLVLRQAGLDGYLALGASYGADGPVFTLTLQAEPPRHVSGPAAVHGLGQLLASQILLSE